MEVMMRKLLLTLLLVLGLFALKAQTVSYSYRVFSAEGCSVSYNPTFVGDTAYIVVYIESDRLVFSENPIMMVRFFNSDQILQLQGEKMNATATNGAIMAGTILVPFLKIKAMAKFKVSEQEMAMFKSGVERIRISTFPITHDRTFRRDRIGQSLYQNYQIEKQKAEVF